MRHIHNAIIRALNSIYLQGPHVHEPKDVQDFLFFCDAWSIVVDHHHEVEEEVFFPALGRLTGDPDIMDKNVEQHHGFIEGLHTFQKYVREIQPEKYHWPVLRSIIDSFAEDFHTHLKDEIPTLMALDSYDDAQWKKVWAEAEKAGKGIGKPGALVCRTFFKPDETKY
jgi:hypothetical protein